MRQEKNVDIDSFRPTFRVNQLSYLGLTVANKSYIIDRSRFQWIYRPPTPVNQHHGRIIISSALRYAALDDLYSTHFGEETQKPLARQTF